MAIPGPSGSDAPPTSTPATPPQDFAGQTTDTIVRIVEQVRDRTTVPLLTASRGLVFGLLAGIVGIAALTLLFIMVVRILNIVLPSGVWVAYLVLGLVLVIAGAVLMRKRRANLEAVLMSAEVRNVVIIGSGPAGLTAAIYAARATLAPLVIEGEPSSTSDQPGGQLMLTTEVENFPGFPEGVMGPELMGRIREQAQRFGAEFLTEKVTSVDFSERPFRVTVRDTTYLAASVIVSTGARSLMLGLDNEHDLIGHGLSTCATCDGFFFRGQHIAVVGGGDSAVEEALFLTKFAETVTLVHRRDQLRASKIMQQRALDNPKIRFAWNRQVVALHGEGKLEGALLQDTRTGDTEELAVTGLFVAIGHRPNTDLFKGQLDLDDLGYLVTKPGSSYTNVDGVFACGDVQDHTYRQAITAAGSGCMAAIDAERWLEANHA